MCYILLGNKFTQVSFFIYSIVHKKCFCKLCSASTKCALAFKYYFKLFTESIKGCLEFFVNDGIKLLDCCCFDPFNPNFIVIEKPADSCAGILAGWFRYDTNIGLK